MRNRLGRSGDPYHQEVSLGVLLRVVGGEDLGSLQILGQRSAEVSILEGAQVLLLGRIRGVQLLGLHHEVCLSEAAARQQIIICMAQETRCVSDGMVDMI